jgi:hypothetical protein
MYWDRRRGKVSMSIPENITLGLEVGSLSDSTDRIIRRLYDLIPL